MNDSRAGGPPPITAQLGPTNTGKTHRAVERMLQHQTGMIGLPLRLLAREIYDRVSARVGEGAPVPGGAAAPAAASGPARVVFTRSKTEAVAGPDEASVEAVGLRQQWPPEVTGGPGQHQVGPVY